MQKNKQIYLCEHTGRRVIPLEIEEMHDSLNTLWWCCPACGDWHAEINEKGKRQNAKTAGSENDVVIQ